MVDEVLGGVFEFFLGREKEVMKMSTLALMREKYVIVVLCCLEGEME